MKIKTIFLCGVLFPTLLVVITQEAFADGENHLRDASFELRLPPDQGGWILFDESMFSTDEVRSGTQSMFNWGFSRSVPYPPYFVGTVSGSLQEFKAAPGSQWRLTGYGAAPIALRGTPAFGIVQVSLFDALGNDSGTVETAGNNTPLPRLRTK